MHMRATHALHAQQQPASTSTLLFAREVHTHTHTHAVAEASHHHATMMKVLFASLVALAAPAADVDAAGTPDFTLTAGIDSGNGGSGEPGAFCGDANNCRGYGPQGNPGFPPDPSDGKCTFESCKNSCLADVSCAGIGFKGNGGSNSEVVCRLCPATGQHSVATPTGTIPGIYAAGSWGVYARSTFMAAGTYTMAPSLTRAARTAVV